VIFVDASLDKMLFVRLSEEGAHRLCAEGLLKVFLLRGIPRNVEW